MIEYVFRTHFRLAVHAALLFTVGLFLSWPVIHYRLEALARLPLALFRFAIRLIGTSPSIARTAGVIFCFNSVAIFVYMASGFHPVLPKIFGVWTGMNIGTIVGMARREEDFLQAGRPSPGQWLPPSPLTAICGVLVLVLELACFWFSIAMGMGMGHAVQAGAERYFDALAVRTRAYALVVLPVLALSAIAEAIAIRGCAGQAPQAET
ncbi:MAG: hypothetical protein KAX44_04985 [Candidatus Brocadiae bacterium]|nr:hypothetical protein [Candidatus Brocadiia bacterium]